MAFKTEGRWERERTYLGKNKEVFDAVVWVIGWALELLDNRVEEGMDYMIFSDAQAAISRVRHDQMGPGQALAIRAISAAAAIRRRENTITIRWTPSHEGIEGNE